jgi:hypothetical protein
LPVGIGPPSDAERSASSIQVAAILGPPASRRGGRFVFPGELVGDSSGGSFATLTHARLRAAQGDVPGAVRILRVILEVQPWHHEARAFLEAIANRPAAPHSEPVPAIADEATPATAQDLALRFREALGSGLSDPRVQRLSSWLERVQRNRGGTHAR